MHWYFRLLTGERILELGQMVGGTTRLAIIVRVETLLAVLSWEAFLVSSTVPRACFHVWGNKTQSISRLLREITTPHGQYP